MPILHYANSKSKLRGNRNVGIFNKGKASSPLKLGHGKQNRITKMTENSNANGIYKFLTLHSLNEGFLPKGNQDLLQSLHPRIRSGRRVTMLQRRGIFDNRSGLNTYSLNLPRNWKSKETIQNN